MPHTCKLQLPEGVVVSLAFSDFNRLRWAVDALGVNPALRRHLAEHGRPVHVCDSVLLQRARTASGPAPSHVVLWDGINSLIEWRQRRHDPSSAQLDESALVWLHVGQLPEAEAALPGGGRPLYPAGSGALAPVQLAPPSLRVQTAVRRRLRPWVQRWQQPSVHRRLEAGGCLVFCGAVRHNCMLLDDSFRGASLPALRRELDDLIDLPWDAEPVRAQARILEAVARLQAAARGLEGLPSHRHAAEWACLYNVLNLLHRQHTLSLLGQRTPRLMVVEFGRQRHFDPYNASAYERNVYLDFGSTCGAELHYPRQLDLALQGKRAVSSRLLRPDQPLRDWLLERGPDGLVQQSASDVDRALLALDALG